MAAFDDGTPLDAAALQDLDRRLTEVKSSIPKIGTTVINNNTVVQEVKQKQIFGGQVSTSSITSGKSTGINVSWPKTDSTPTAVIFTPKADSISNSISYSVSNLGIDGCTLNVFMPTTGKTATKASVGFYYIVICS